MSRTGEQFFPVRFCIDLEVTAYYYYIYSVFSCSGGIGISPACIEIYVVKKVLYADRNALVKKSRASAGKYSEIFFRNL